MMVKSNMVICVRRLNAVVKEKGKNPKRAVKLAMLYGLETIATTTE